MTQSYDPNKRYKWDKDAKLELTGHQFGTLLNAFRGVLNTPEASRIITIYHANDIIEEIMAEGVEKGIIIESPDVKTQGQAGMTILKDES